MKSVQKSTKYKDDKKFAKKILSGKNSSKKKKIHQPNIIPPSLFLVGGFVGYLDVGESLFGIPRGVSRTCQLQ